MTGQAAANLEELLRQQESLRTIIESISSELELRPLLTRIVQHACELLHADRGTIGLVDEARNLIRTEAVYRMPPGELGAEMAPGVGLAGKVLQTQETVILNQYGALEQPMHANLLDDAVIGLPIFWHGRMIGFFGIGAAPPRVFNNQDIESLTLLARHAAIAIANARLFDQTQRNLAETQLLYETSRRITAAFDVDDVIEAYLQLVATRGHYVCSVALYEFDTAGERTAVIVRGRWTPHDGIQLLQERVPYDRDALDPLLDAGQTVLIADVHTDPRVTETLRQLQTKSGRPALALIPLIVRRWRIGLVILSYPAVHHWSESDLWPYQVTAAQLATAIDTRQQQLLLVQSSQEVAVLRERQRLARELHDSVTQLIFSMTLIAQSIAPAWQRDPAQGQQRVDRLLELSQSALAEMRALLFELHSATTPLPAASSPAMPGSRLPDTARLKRDGLVATLEKHIANVTREGPAIQFDAPTYRPLPPDDEVALYRIAQEALNNVVKHAQAKQVMVELVVENGITCLLVVDDGVGFNVSEENPNSLSAAASFGLQTMRERAEALGGSVDISSSPGRGTTVKVRLPRSDGGRE